MSPDVLDQLVGRQHLARMLDEREEQPELERGEADGQATAHHEPLAVVDRESSVVVVLDVRRLRGAPQECLDPRQQLLAAEGLDDVVVCPGPKAAHLVDLAAARREQDHRDVAQVAEALERLEAVELRHREVQDDEIGWIRVERPQRRAAVHRRHDAVAGAAQQLLEQKADVVVVVNDEHPPQRRRHHRAQYEECSGR